MLLIRTWLKTLIDLGLLEVVTVILYRLMTRLGVHPGCFLNGSTVNGPFFAESKLPDIGLAPISTWDDHATLFSYINVPLVDHPPDWMENPIAQSQTKLDLRPWWKISDFDEERGDIKLIWEQSRMDWVVAFAQRIRNEDQETLTRLNAWLEDWLEKNPPYLGVNWKCGQEASIRVINLCCAALILGQESQSLPGLQELIRLHLKRIKPTIHYAMAQNNNHGTSEAAALFIGGSWLAAEGLPDGKLWEKVGRNWLENRVGKLVEKDGSFSQYSLNYHRVLIDTLSITEVWRQRIKQPSFSLNFYKKASLAVSWLYQMVSPISGDGPNLGANDGARFLQLTDSPYRDYRPSIQLGMALFCDRRAYSDRGLWDFQLAWLGIPYSKKEAARYSNCDYDYGGYKILRSGQASIFFRYPRFRFRPSQADALHLDLWFSGSNLLCDAGSYSYNSVPDLSGYFSGAVGHNTVQFDDRDQMPKLSRFLFGSWLKASRVTPIVITDGVVGCSAGYRDAWGGEHVRAVHLFRDSLRVIDDVKGFNQKAVLRWRLPVSLWKIQHTSDGVHVSDGDSTLEVTADVPIIGGRITQGWVSKFYMSKESVPVLEVEIDRAGQLSTEYQWAL